MEAITFRRIKYGLTIVPLKEENNRLSYSECRVKAKRLPLQHFKIIFSCSARADCAENQTQDFPVIVVELKRN